MDTPRSGVHRETAGPVTIEFAWTIRGTLPADPLAVIEGSTRITLRNTSGQPLSSVRWRRDTSFNQTDRPQNVVGIEHRTGPMAASAVQVIDSLPYPFPAPDGRGLPGVRSIRVHVMQVTASDGARLGHPDAGTYAATLRGTSELVSPTTSIT